MKFIHDMKCYISSLLRLLLNAWTWYKGQNWIEKYYRHDGEQVSFNLYERNEEFQIYLIKTVLKTTSNAIFNMKKTDLGGS